jgi:ParB-like chromosome segregation protein Spo0J
MAEAAVTKENGKADAKPSPDSTIKIHPLANLLPRMTKKEYAELTEDVKANGIQMPLLFTKDKKTLIDGRHRWYVAHDLGLKISSLPIEYFKGKDDEIPNVIISRNLMRRNIEDADQRVAIALQIRGETLEKEAKERQADKSGAFKESGKKGPMVAQLAKDAKVSQHKAEQAVKAKKAGLLGKVASGVMKLRDAAKKSPQSKRGQTMAKKKAGKPFDQTVWKRWLTWLKQWKPEEVREVKGLIRGWLAGKKGPDVA